MAATPDIYIVAIKPNGDIIPLRQINTVSTQFGEIIDPLNVGNNYIYNNKSIILSSSLLSIEQDKIGIAVKFPGPGWRLRNLDISNFELSTPTGAQTNSPDNIYYEPDFTEDFTNNDWNALLGNAFIPRHSQYFMDVDYSTSPIVGSSLTPINFDQLIAGTATRAPIQDYYYNLRRHIIPRYLGSKSTAPSFNTFSTDVKNKGFGKDIVAGNPKPFVGYYGAKGGSTPEVIGKTIINLDYIIDENIQTQVPALSDFTYNNQIQLFERGTYLYLDPDKKSTSQQFAGNRKYKIYRSGEYATPILYSQTGSNPGYIDKLNFANPDIDTILDYYNTSILPNNTGTWGQIGYRDAMWYVKLYGEGSPFYTINTTDTWFPILLNNTSFITPPESGYIISWDPGSFTSQIGSYIYTFGSSPDVYELKYPTPPPFLQNTGLTTKIKVKYKVKNISGTTINSSTLQATTIKLTLGIYKRSNGTLTYLSEIQNTIVEQTKTIAPGEISEFNFESPLFTPDLSTYGLVAKINYFNGTTAIPNAYYYPFFRTLEGSFEVIQNPSPNSAEIFKMNGNYITSVLDLPYPVPFTSNIIPSPILNSPTSVIAFTSSFSNVYGLIYTQISGSGYDSTIYPFEITPLYPEITTQPEYEIRFAADETLVFPIVSIIKSDTSDILNLLVSRPENQLLANLPLETLQSFLIRRWIPRAGYIYLDVNADLGAGIVKPEYITDGIKNKIPQIVKELTDKGLIQ
jgi:hypothetical protein